MLHHNTYAQVVAFYGDPLPIERAGRAYGETIIRAKIAALQSLLGESEAIRWDGPRVAPKPARRATARKKAMTAEQFFDAFQHARRAVCEAVGDRWVVLGLGTWATLPAGWRSFTGPRGGKVRLPKDVRLPPAEYWPGGVLPDGLVFTPPSRGLTPWVEFEGVAMDPALVRLSLAHREQVAADKPARLAARLTDAIRCGRANHSMAIGNRARFEGTDSTFAENCIATQNAHAARHRASVHTAIAEYRAAMAQLGEG